MPGPDGAGWGDGGQPSAAAASSSSWSTKGGWGEGNTGQQATERPTAAGQCLTDEQCLNQFFGSRIKYSGFLFLF